MTATTNPLDWQDGATAFEGRRAVVTGGNSGIGRAIAAGLLRRGADVIVLDVDTDEVVEGAHGYVVDVSSEPEVRSVVDRIQQDHGHVDTLFNNAGVGSTATVIDCPVEEWDRVFAVNVRGMYLGMRYLLPGMLERGHGVIVNTASAAGMIGLPDRAAYCASKAAVIGLTKQVAVQWASQGIRCTAISPGTVDSPWVRRLLAEAEDPELHREELIARQPMGRLGTPQEIAETAIFLASDTAGFITGSGLVIDGGITAG